MLITKTGSSSDSADLPRQAIPPVAGLTYYSPVPWCLPAAGLACLQPGVTDPSNYGSISFLSISYSIIRYSI